MSFRKPFRASPVVPSRQWARRQRRRRRRDRFGSGLLAVTGFLAALSWGLVATNWSPVDARVERARSTRGNCAMMSVHDGDTIRCGAERIRIENIDAPELPGSPKCRGARAARAWCDYRLGYRSRDELRAFLAQGPVHVERHGEDRYGRTLAVVSVSGRDSGAFLVQRGLAKWWE